MYAKIEHLCITNSKHFDEAESDNDTISFMLITMLLFERCADALYMAQLKKRKTITMLGNKKNKQEYSIEETAKKTTDPNRMSMYKMGIVWCICTILEWN